MRIQNINNNIFAFKGVKEAESVWNSSKPTIREALNILGEKNISILMHGNSFPSLPEEDFSIGSPYCNGAKELANFFDGVIDKCVLGPWGVTTSDFKHSPYNSSLESLNPFFINFKFLTTAEGNRLLSVETFNEIVKNNPNKNNRINYDYVEVSVNKMLDEAYKNFKKRSEENDLDIKKLSKKINSFKKENFGIYLDAIYDSLSKEYQSSNFHTWKKLDQELPLLLEDKDKTAQGRLNEIEKKYESNINKYLFTQYLAKKHVELAPMPYIADKQVALRSSDEWKLQDIILREIKGKSISLGVPGDSFSPTGRCWGIPQIDYEKLFNPDGSFTNGGRRLFNIYRKIFRNNKGGVRIDHFQGIIDPYVCVNKSPEKKDGAGRLLSSPKHHLFGNYAILTPKNIDLNKPETHIDRIKYLTKKQVKAYGKFFERIILAAARAEGLDETNIMPEDLGSITKPTLEVIKRNKLGSMKVTQFVNPDKVGHTYRGKNSNPWDFITTGTHDTKSLIGYFYEMPQSKYNNHINMLSEDLGIARPKNKKDRKYGIQLKFAELFTAPAKNVQIFFTHLLGLNEWYNKPGDKTFTKWSLRMPNNFKEIYFKNLQAGLAFNPFDALARALKTKNNPEYNSIIKKLKHFESKLLKAI